MPGDRVGERDHDPTEGKSGEQPGAGGGPAVVCAGLQCHIRSDPPEELLRDRLQKIVDGIGIGRVHRHLPTGQRLIGFEQRPHFGMRFSRPAVRFDREEPPLADQRTAYGRIGIGQPLIMPCLPKCQLHKKTIVDPHRQTPGTRRMKWLRISVFS